MSKFIYLLDPGHGGMINGRYTTAPAKMHIFKEEGFAIYEGVFNRKVTAFLMESLTEHGIPFYDVVNSNEDVPLSTRVQRANRYAEQAKQRGQRCLYLSIHGNAGGGTGFEVWTSKGETESDQYATIFGEELMAGFPEQKYRADYSDGDLDKEEQFFVLRKTFMPAVLTENLFMDRLEDARLMMSGEGQRRIADAHFRAILRIEGRA